MDKSTPKPSVRITNQFRKQQAMVYDLSCEVIDDPMALAVVLKGLTGVVEHGLFLGLAERALIGTDSGVTTLYP